MKQIKILKKYLKTAIALSVFVGHISVVGAQTKSTDASPVNKTGSEKNDDTEDSGKTVFGKVKMTGEGGGPFFLYGFGSDLGDSLIFGGRGYMLFGETFRVGVVGSLVSDTKSNPQKGAALAGLMAEHLLRMDPFIIGFGLVLGGAGYEETGANADYFNKHTYFITYPYVELEIRMFSKISLSVLGGYILFVGKDSAPLLSNFNVGIAVTYARF